MHALVSSSSAGTLAVFRGCARRRLSCLASWTGRRERLAVIGRVWRAQVDLSLKKIDVITLFVEDLDRSKAFYERVFGLPVVYEDEDSAVFRFENIDINLLTLSAAYELIDPGTVASREAGSRLQFTIAVDDVDAACAEPPGGDGPWDAFVARC